MFTFSRFHFAALLYACALFFAASVVSVTAQEKEGAAPQTQQSQEEASPEKGQAAFNRVCKVCHGPEAQGDGGPRLVPFNLEFDQLLGIVREGTGQMPPISARELPDDDVKQIIVYLKSLSK